MNDKSNGTLCLNFMLCKRDKRILRHLMLKCKNHYRTTLKEREIFAEEVKDEVIEWCRELERKWREVQNAENKLQGTVLKKDSAIRNMGGVIYKNVNIE